MRNKWTRERIIRNILECEAEGLPLTVGEPGISQSLYQAGARIFGSWQCDPSRRLPARTGQLWREVAAGENSYNHSQPRSAPSPPECKTV